MKSAITYSFLFLFLFTTILMSVAYWLGFDHQIDVDRGVAPADMLFSDRLIWAFALAFVYALGLTAFIFGISKMMKIVLGKPIGYL